jgi:endothelin-converting enzyme
LKIYLSRRTRLERSLIFTILLLLFFIFLSSLTIFFHQHELKHSEEICLTPACIQVSSSIYSGMNQTMNPCDDFYEFTCGRWIKTNIIPKGHSGWSTTKELSRKNLIILKSILEETMTNNSNSIFNAEQEAIKFYQSCMNISEIERRQIQPLEQFLNENFNLTIKQWIDIDQNQTWQNLFVSLTKILSKKYGFSYLLPISVGPDDKNSTWNVLHVSITHSRLFLYLIFPIRLINHNLVLIVEIIISIHR